MCEYEVKGLICGGCVNSIRRVIKKSDPEATVFVEIDQGIVRVQSANGSDEIAIWIEKAGFKVVKSRLL